MRVVRSLLAWSGRRIPGSTVTTAGRLIKICSVVNEYTRECLGGIVDSPITHRLDRRACGCAW
jgi:hypothetical protein